MGLHEQINWTQQSINPSCLPLSGERRVSMIYWDTVLHNCLARGSLTTAQILSAMGRLMIAVLLCVMISQVIKASIRFTACKQWSHFRCLPSYDNVSWIKCVRFFFPRGFVQEFLSWSCRSFWTRKEWQAMQTAARGPRQRVISVNAKLFLGFAWNITKPTYLQILRAPTVAQLPQCSDQTPSKFPKASLTARSPTPFLSLLGSHGRWVPLFIYFLTI